MKKIFCIIAALTFLITFSASADEHIEVSGTFTGSLEGNVISFDLYEQDNQTVVVSSLFPEIAVYMDQEIYEPDLLFLMTPDSIRSAELILGQTLDSWIETQTLHSEEGVFAGSLFDESSIEMHTSFTVSDFITFFQTASTDINSDDLFTHAIFRSIISGLNRILSIAEDPDLLVHYRRYENGIFETLSFISRNSTILTISIDHAQKDSKKILFEYNSQSRYYFREYIYNYLSEKVNLSCAFYSSSSSVYSKVKNQAPAFKETFELFNGTDNTSGFQYSLESNSLSSPLLITGDIIQYMIGSAEIRADLHIQDYEDEQMKIIAFQEKMNRTVAFSDKTPMHLQNEKDRAEVTEAVMSGITNTAAKLIYTLPVPYQNLLISLFFYP